ncbi:MAG: hypothetical protein P4L84_22780 [Isosphaeraceae bacterium]|nr:hypothetical protein [Isosphaeraceae bacterium]
MNAKSEVTVTLSDELYKQLNAEATALGVALEWLVASLVVDTFETECA